MQKRILSLLLVLCLLFALAPVTLAAGETAPWTGEGTSAKPYQITNRADLEALATSVNGGNHYAGKYFKLVADIDLDGQEWTPIGNSASAFQGDFDGGKHTIKNLVITKGLENIDANNCVGLFGHATDGAVIRNLTIENVDITGSLYVGAVVGYNFTGKEIKNCHVKGLIEIDAWWYAGVIGGNGYVSSVDSCTVTGSDGSYIKGNEGSYIGGIWGFRGEGGMKITNCTVDGLTISGDDRVGGICGILHYGNLIQSCTVSNAAISSTEDQNNTGLIAGADQSTAVEGENVCGKLLDCTVGENVTATAADTPVTTKLGAANNDGELKTEELRATVGSNVTFDKTTGKVTGGVLEQVGTSQVADYMRLVENGDGTIGTEFKETPKVVVELGSFVTAFDTLEEAFKSVDGNATITLYQNVTATETLSLQKQYSPVLKVYLELGGHTLTGDIVLAKNTYLYINENSQDQTGEVNGSLTASGTNTKIEIHGGHMAGKLTAGTGSEKGIIQIRNGYITGELEKGANGTLECYGGYSKNDPSDYLTSGYVKMELEAADEFGCQYKIIEDQVAKIERDGETVIYKTLKEAVSNAKDTETIVLLKDVDLKNAQVDIGKSITIDLGQKTVTGTHPQVLYINKYAAPAIDVTIKNGTLENGSTDDNTVNRAILVNQRVQLTLEDVKLVAGSGTSYGLQIGEEDKLLDPTVTIKGAETEIRGALAGISIFNKNSTEKLKAGTAAGVSGTLCVEDGVITGGWYGIAGHGEGHLTSITVKGGTVKQTIEGGAGIFHPQSGTLTVSGGTIEGGTGIEVRSGTLNVNGGTIRGTSETFETVQNSSGSTSMGVGIAVSQHVTNLPITVNINRAGEHPPVISGQYALYEKDLQDDLEKDKISITITDGEFTSIAADTATKAAVYSENVQKFISGGSYNTDPTPYLAEGYITVPSEKEGYPYTVVEKTAQAPDISSAVGADVVTVGDGVADGDKETVKTLAGSVTVDEGALADAAVAAAEHVTWEQKANAEAAVKADGSGVTVEAGDAIHVYSQVYLSITPTAYADGAVTMDIVPMSRIVASTAATPADIKVVGEVETGANAVVLAGSEALVTTIITTPITVDLPDGFVPAEGTAYYARHTHGTQVYHYPLTITEESGKRTASFVNLHGFSEFVLPVTLENAAASVTDRDGNVTMYETLEDAVKEAVAAGGCTVKLERDVRVDTWNQVWNAADLIIDGNGKTLTVGKVESKMNGDFLFYKAEDFNVSNLTVNFETNGNGFWLNSGTLDHVTMTGSAGSSYAVYVGLTANSEDEVVVDACDFSGFGIAIYSQPTNEPGKLTTDTTVTNSTITGGLAIVSFAPNTTFTNNTVENTSELSFAAKQDTALAGADVTYTVTDNIFQDAGKIWFYAGDLENVEFERNQVLGATTVSTENAAGGTLDASGNYWGGGEPGDKLQGAGDNTRVDDYYEQPDMTTEENLNTYHTITVDRLDGGTVVTDPVKGTLEGRTVTVTAIPDPGYVTRDVTYTVGEDTSAITMIGGTGAFIMPTGDVKVSAAFDAYSLELDTVPVTLEAGGSRKIGTATVPTGLDFAASGEDGVVEITLEENGDIMAKGLKSGTVEVTFAIKQGETALVSVTKPLTVATYHTITATHTGEGEVTVSPGVAKMGDTVTVTVTPGESYRLDRVTATTQGGNVPLTKTGDTTYSFTMPDSDVAVHADFIENIAASDVYTLSVDTDPAIEVGSSKKIGSATVSDGLTFTVTPETSENVTFAWTDGDIIATGIKAGAVEVTFAIVKGGETLESVTRTVTVTDKAAPVTTKPSVTTYPVTVTETENGTVSVSVKRAAKGSTVTVTATPGEGFTLDTLTVIDAKGGTVELTAKGDGQYTFQMPGTEVKITAKFAQATFSCDGGESCPCYNFADIAAKAWYHEGADYVVSRGLMRGISQDLFAPEVTASRAMIVTILHRLEGEPAAKDVPFTDVAEGTYYTAAVAWAAQNGIVNGYGDGTFGPENGVTREQLATILHRYAAYKGWDVTAQGDLSGYTDAGEISAYAVDAMTWANAQGIIVGTDKSVLLPTGQATRAQLAAVLMRFCETVAK